MLTYHEFSSSVHLKAYLSKFWMLDNLSSSSITETKYALPNTCFTLAFINGNGVLVTQGNCSHIIGEGVFVVGQISAKTGVALLPATKAFMLQLNASAAPLLTNCPFYELTNGFTHLADINKQLAGRFSGLSMDDPNLLKFGVEKTLAGVFQTSRTSALVSYCFNELKKNTLSHNFSIKKLSESLNCSPRKLEKQFKQHVGLPPKQVYTILKIRAAVDDLLCVNSNKKLTDLAYQYGYFDQAHFIKTFKTVIDTTPGKFDKQHYILPLQM